MQPLLVRTKDLITLVLVFCVGITVLIWLQLLRQNREDRDNAIALAIQGNDNLVAAFEQATLHTLVNANEALQLVKWTYQTQGASFSINNLYHQGLIDTTLVNGIAVLDANGKILQSDLPLDAHSPIKLNDRKHFFIHKIYPDTLFLSEPVVSRTLGKPVVILSCRLNASDGRFAGTVAVQILTSTFTNFYRKAKMKEHDLISLIAPGGMTYARRTGSSESWGENISKSPLFRYVAHQPVGNYFARDAIRGVPTYFSYRKLEHFPIIVTVGSSQRDVLADFHQRSRQRVLFGVLLSGLLLIFAGLVIRVLRLKKKANDRLSESEARYRSIFDNSHDGLVVLACDGTLEAINPAARKLFLLPLEAQPRSLGELFSSSTPQLTAFDRQLAACEEYHAEIIFERRDGSSLAAALFVTHYHTAAGDRQGLLLLRDLTAQKQMERQLLREQKRYQRRLTQQIIWAQEREREHIGRELHDNINQVLTSVKLYLETVQYRPEGHRSVLDKSIDLVQTCITDIRNLSRELSAPTLGTQSLVDSMKALVEMVQSASKIRIRMACRNYHTLLPKEQTLAFYRILQEQLNNIVRHAQATRVIVIISQGDGRTRLLVTDNGKGFDVRGKREGIGLSNIQSRAKVLAGSVKIEAAPGKGCTLIVDLPLQ